MSILARPSLRGSAPLDVASASVMDNNELALALRESHLEKIASYLSRCGTTRNEELFLQGYHDIGWDPVDGERLVYSENNFVHIHKISFIRCSSILSFFVLLDFLIFLNFAFGLMVRSVTNDYF